MRLNDEQNIQLMNDKRILNARSRLDGVLNRLHASIRFNGSAEYYLRTLPQYLKELESAYEDMCTIEANVSAEILKNQKSKPP